MKIRNFWLQFKGFQLQAAASQCKLQYNWNAKSGGWRDTSNPLRVESYQRFLAKNALLSNRSRESKSSETSSCINCYRCWRSTCLSLAIILPVKVVWCYVTGSWPGDKIFNLFTTAKNSQKSARNFTVKFNPHYVICFSITASEFFPFSSLSKSFICAESHTKHTNCNLLVFRGL